MPLVILRSPLPVKERDASAQEEADRHYSLGYREGLRDALEYALGDGAYASIYKLRDALGHVEATGSLPAEEADRAG